MFGKGVKDIQTQIKRESKSFEAIQQGTVIAILNTLGFGFEFKRPERIAEKTIQFLVITEVYYKGQPLNFGKKIDGYVDEQFQTEVVANMSINQIKSLKRRRDLNRAALSFNWLIEYIEQFGYVVERRSTKSAKKTLQMEKISKISQKDGLVFTPTEMQFLGKEVNAHVISQFVKLEKTTLLQEYSPLCFDLLRYSDVHRKGSVTYYSFEKEENQHSNPQIKIENKSGSDSETIDECCSTLKSL